MAGEAINLTALEHSYRDSLGCEHLADGDFTMSALTHARLLRLFDYNAVTGSLIWKVSESNRIKIGSVAGAIGRNGRRYVGVDGERQLAHRLVWFFHKGEWPSENLAPVNGDYLDTRIENLVEQTAQETVQKGKLRSTNHSGIKGVWFDKARGKWAVQTVHNYRTTFHGRYDTLEEAQAALTDAQGAEELSRDEVNKRKQAKRANSHQRRLWAQMLRACNGRHEWPSIEAFVADVGSSPQPKYYIAPADASRPVGPGNFVWSAPQYDYSNRDGRLAANRLQMEKLPHDYHRDRHFRRDFGMDGINEYKDKFAEQGGVCAICSQPETAMRRNKVLPLHVDHDHATGAVRGLLCSACNLGIGQLRDSPELMHKAISYIETWKEIHNKPLPENVVKLKRD